MSEQNQISQTQVLVPPEAPKEDHLSDFSSQSNERLVGKKRRATRALEDESDDEAPEIQKEEPPNSIFDQNFGDLPKIEPKPEEPKVSVQESGEDRSRKNSYDESRPNQQNFVMKNGCCPECMKAFSKTGKSCLCQVPKAQRRATLPPNGCKYCNCKGCNPIDIIKQKRQEMKTKLKQDGYGKYSRKRQRLLDSDDDENDFTDGFVSLGAGQQNRQYDEWNRAKRDFCELIHSLTQVDTLLMGIGAPSRHQSYIFGRPQETITERGRGYSGDYQSERGSEVARHDNHRNDNYSDHRNSRNDRNDGSGYGRRDNYHNNRRPDNRNQNQGGNHHGGNRNYSNMRNNDRRDGNHRNDNGGRNGGGNNRYRNRRNSDQQQSRSQSTQRQQTPSHAYENTPLSFINQHQQPAPNMPPVAYQQFAPPSQVPGQPQYDISGQ